MTNALFVVDVQLWGFGDHKWRFADADDLLPRLAARLEEAREAGWTIVHVQNDGDEGELDAPGAPMWPMMLEPRDGELHVRKNVPDTFVSNPDLAQRLRELGVTDITMIGCQSEMCVRSTALGAKEAGFKVTVPAGLHGTYDSEGKTADQIKAEVDAELSATL